MALHEHNLNISKTPFLGAEIGISSINAFSIKIWQWFYGVWCDIAQNAHADGIQKNQVKQLGIRRFEDEGKTYELPPVSHVEWPIQNEAHILNSKRHIEITNRLPLQNQSHSISCKATFALQHPASTRNWVSTINDLTETLMVWKSLEVRGKHVLHA